MVVQSRKKSSGVSSVNYPKNLLLKIFSRQIYTQTMFDVFKLETSKMFNFQGKYVKGKNYARSSVRVY
jgi:hypothetical protein